MCKAENLFGTTSPTPQENQAEENAVEESNDFDASGTSRNNNEELNTLEDNQEGLTARTENEESNDVKTSEEFPDTSMDTTADVENKVIENDTVPERENDETELDLNDPNIANATMKIQSAAKGFIVRNNAAAAANEATVDETPRDEELAESIE